MVVFDQNQKNGFEIKVRAALKPNTDRGLDSPGKVYDSVPVSTRNSFQK